jgi:amino-acid N-acetyltransferase
MTALGRYSIESVRDGDKASVFQLLERCDLPIDGLAEHFATCLVARRETSIVGTIALEVHGASALLRSLAVDSQDRGCGLGQALTSAVMDVAARRGIGDVYLLTETASEFFGRLGFAPIDRQSVPDSVKRSVEFTSACPQSALAMHMAVKH